MREHIFSQRRACQLVGVDPKTVRLEHPPDNPEIHKEMKAIAAKCRRFGHRRIGVMLERKGMIMNHKKLFRLYTEERLGVRRRRGRKPAKKPQTFPLRRPFALSLGRLPRGMDPWLHVFRSQRIAADDVVAGLLPHHD